MAQWTYRQEANDTFAELRVSVSTEPGDANELALESAGATVLHIGSKRDADGHAVISCRVGDTVAEITFSGEGTYHGTIAGHEVAGSWNDPARFEDIPSDVVIDHTTLSGLPIADLANGLRGVMEDDPSDECTACKLGCLITYAECISACGDPSTTPGAICYARCMFGLYQCEEGCPCQEPPANS